MMRYIGNTSHPPEIKLKRIKKDFIFFIKAELKIFKLTMDLNFKDILRKPLKNYQKKFKDIFPDLKLLKIIQLMKISMAL